MTVNENSNKHNLFIKEQKGHTTQPGDERRSPSRGPPQAVRAQREAHAKKKKLACPITYTAVQD